MLDSDGPMTNSRKTIPLWPLALLFLVVGAAPVEAAPSFPRGPGFYFNPYHLGALFVVYLIWIRLVRWADEDAQAYNLPTSTWNGMLIGSGVAGLLCIWLLPNFW